MTPPLEENGGKGTLFSKSPIRENESSADRGNLNPGERPALSSVNTVTYSASPGFVSLLVRLDVSVAVSSYQSGKLYLLGHNPNGGLMINERLFPKAMGIAVSKETLLLAAQFQIQRFENVLEAGELVNETYDACYVPRTTHITGALDAHDVGFLADGSIIFVNTRYNCLAMLSPKRSFTPVWKPSFISGIVDENRCHLNGLAIENGAPRYVTAVSRSDTIDGWRDRRANGGVVIDVASGEIVCEGLSMPHSPRLYKDRLWVLNSGAGEFGWVDLATGKFHFVAFCPGFLRGLAFHGRYAFIGLSKPRYARFEGLALDERLTVAGSEAWCGIQVIDLETGARVEWFRIDGDVSEIYDLATLGGVSCPMLLGFANSEIEALITHDPFVTPGK